MNSTRVTRGLSPKRRTQRKKRVPRSKRRVSKRVRRTKYRRRRQKAGVMRTQDPQQDQQQQGPQQDADPQRREPLSPVVPVHKDEHPPTVTTPIKTDHTRKKSNQKRFQMDGKKNYGETIVKLLSEAPYDPQVQIGEHVAKIRKMQSENITLTTLGPFVGNWSKRIKKSDPENYYYEFVADMELSGDIWTIFDAFYPYRRYLYDMKVPEVKVPEEKWPGDLFFDEYVLDNSPTTD